MFKALISLVLLVFGALYAAPAHAQHFTYAYCNGVWVPGSCQQPISGHVGPNQWQQQQQQQQQQMQQVQVLQAAHAVSQGFTRCQTIGGITGATLGSLAKNHRIQAVILGAIAGGITADMVCSNTQGQQVMVMNAPQQVVQPHAVQTLQMPSARVIQRAEQAPVVEEGDLRCPLHFNGQEVQVFMVQNDEDCMKVVEWEARRRGWVRAN